jgi:hypothetical protein
VPIQPDTIGCEEECAHSVIRLLHFQPPHPLQSYAAGSEIDVNSTRVKSLQTQTKIRADGAGREMLAEKATTSKRHDISIATPYCLLISD